jgi:hypothetical protein
LPSFKLCSVIAGAKEASVEPPSAAQTVVVGAWAVVHAREGVAWLHGGAPLGYAGSSPLPEPRMPPVVALNCLSPCATRRGAPAPAPQGT